MSSVTTCAKTFLILLLGLSPSITQGQDMDEKKKDDGMEAHMAGHTYEMDKAHSQVTFKVRHLGVSNVRGTFHDVSASIFLDPTDLTTLATEAVISVSSVDTRNENRDSDLRSDRFFDVETFPEMKFASTGVSDIGDDGTFKLHGQLTIRDVTHDVEFEAEFDGPVVNRGQERFGISATTTIDRFEFGLKWDSVTEFGGLVVDRDVEIIVEVEARRPIE